MVCSRRSFPGRRSPSGQTPNFHNPSTPAKTLPAPASLPHPQNSRVPATNPPTLSPATHDHTTSATSTTDAHHPSHIHPPIQANLQVLEIPYCKTTGLPV